LELWGEVMVRAAATALAMLAIAAPAAAQEAPPPKLDLETQSKDCEAAEPGEVVVCGERGGDKYRLDPDVLHVIRKAEEAANPPRPPAQIAESDPCKVGPNGCPGEGALPLLAIAMKAVEVAVTAAKGEDWREPLRTRPDQYRLYRESKEKREKPKISIELSGPKVERPGY